MTNRAAFLREIAANPADYGPRLTYADWLEERGEDDHAEFIRLGVGLASNQPHSDEAIELDFRAGAIKVVTCRFEEWQRHHAAICAVHPVRTEPGGKHFHLIFDYFRSTF